MQRRAAAAYVVLFVLLAGGSYAFIATAQAPTVTLDNADHELTEGDEFSVGDRTYEVTGVTREEEDDGHGGTEVTLSATLEWTDEAAPQSETFDRGGELEAGNTTYDVVIPNESDPGTATLREQPGDDVETVERDGETFVVVENDEGNDELVPVDEYEPLERIELSDGGQFDWDGTTVDVEVYQDNVTFRWEESQTNEVELSHEQNATLNDRTFLVYIEDGERLLLTTDFENYQEQVDTIDRFEQRINGFWGVTILAGLAAVLMAAMAYMPHKDT